MIDFVAMSVRPRSGVVGASNSGMSMSVAASAPGAKFNFFGAVCTGASGETTWCMVTSSSPQSIDQLPSAIADDANSLTTNMLTTARNSENIAYQSNRQGR